MRRSTRFVGVFAAIAAATASVAACSLIDTSDLTGGVVTNDAQMPDATTDTSMPANDAATTADAPAADADMDATDAARDANDGALADDAAMDAGDAADAADAYDANSALPPYVQAVLDDQPTAYWRFEEPAMIGSIAYSTVNASTYDGVYGGGLTSNHGRGAPGALGPDGGTSIAQVPGNGGGISTGRFFPLSTSAPITFELLLCANAVPAVETMEFPILFTGGTSDSQYVLSYNRATSGSTPELELVNNQLSVYLQPPSPIIGEWMHLVLVFSGGQVTAYENSLFEGSKSYPSHTTDAGVLPFTIGSDVMGNNLFSGNIDELAIYESALSPERITAHFLLVPSVATNRCSILDAGTDH